MGLGNFAERTERSCGWRASVRKDLTPTSPRNRYRSTNTWEFTTAGCIIGIMVDCDPNQRSVIALKHDSDGIH